MIIYNVEQRGGEWHKIRGKIPTASQFARIISSSGAISGQFDSYLDEINGVKHKKNIMTAAMQDGIDNEQFALQAVENEYFINIDDVGFISNDDKTAGCSPDGVILDTTDKIVAGVEVKSVIPTVFDKYTKAGKLPNIYYPQVMGSMAICEVDKWYFGAYDFASDKLFSLEVGRDEKWIKRFWQLIEVFSDKIRV